MRHYQKILDVIYQKAPGFVPKIGLVLGSGLGVLTDYIEPLAEIPYKALPGFPQTRVVGHPGQMTLAKIADVPVVLLRGRIHHYEGATSEDFQVFIRTLKLLGCEILILTNACGSLRKKVKPGELGLITDHINLQFKVPLTGINDEIFGQRFFAMDNAYDIDLQHRFIKAAKILKMKLYPGVYGGTLGPCYETPAEIRAYRKLGVDYVAMSVVPEVIVARHCGLKVACVSVVSNYAAGMVEKSIHHEETLHYGKHAASKLALLLKQFANDLKNADHS